MNSVRSVFAPQIIAEAGLLCLLAGLPVALGAVHRPVILVGALVATMTLMAAARYRRQTRQRFQITAFGALLLALTAYTALQALPLPITVLRLLSGTTVDVLETSLARIGMPAWHPISLEPGNTLWETVKIGTITAAFLAAANLLGRRRRQLRVLYALCATGILLSFLGFVGAVAAQHKPLLFYQPVSGQATGLITTSFVNPNHGAAFLMVCTLVAMSLALRQRDVQRRVLLALGAAFLGTSVMLTLSRGGILSLGLATSLLALLLMTFGDAKARGMRQTSLLVATAGAIVALAGWLAYDGIAREFGSVLPSEASKLGKLEVWPAGLSMIGANWLVGVGRGAMMTALPRYFEAPPPQATYSHLENQYLHLPAELGLIVGVAVIVGSILAWTVWLRHARGDALKLAVAAGIAGIAIHNGVDFSLELLGIAAPLAILAGLLAAGTRRAGQGDRADRDSKREVAVRTRRLVSGTSFANSFAILLGLTAVGVSAFGPPSPRQDALRLQSIDGSAQHDQAFRAAVENAIKRHPADYLLHLHAAQRASVRNQPETLRWINQALALFPNSPDIHLGAARALLRFGQRRQALLEARLAIERGATAWAVLGWALPLCRSNSDILRLLPAMPPVHRQAIAQLLAAERTDLAWSMVQSARERWPNHVALMATEVEVQLSRGRLEEARDLARQLVNLEPASEHFRLLATAEERVSGPTQAVKVLKRAVKRLPDAIDLGLDLALLHMRAKNFARALETANEALKQADDGQSLARAHRVLAQIYRAAGRIHRARLEAEQARKFSQED